VQSPGRQLKHILFTAGRAWRLHAKHRRCCMALGGLSKKKRCDAHHDTFRGRGRHGQRHIAVFRALAAEDKTLNTHPVDEALPYCFSVLDPDRYKHTGPGSRHGCLAASHFLFRQPSRAADSSMPGHRGLRNQPVPSRGLSRRKCRKFAAGNGPLSHKLGLLISWDRRETEQDHGNAITARISRLVLVCKCIWSSPQFIRIPVTFGQQNSPHNASGCTSLNRQAPALPNLASEMRPDRALDRLLT